MHSGLNHQFAGLGNGLTVMNADHSGGHQFANGFVLSHSGIRIFQPIPLGSALIAFDDASFIKN